MTTKKPITLSLSASQLHSLLGDALPFADPDKFSLPVLSCVHLLGHGDHITASATDRYVIGIKRAELSAPKTLDALIHRDAIRRILAMFKPSRKADPQLNLTFTNERVTVETGDALDGLALDARVSFELERGEYPGLRSIFTDNIANTLEGGSLGLNPHKLAQFKHLGTLVFHPTGDNKPVIVRAENFLGAIMPIRHHAHESWHSRDLSDWTPLVPAKKAEKKPGAKGAAA